MAKKDYELVADHYHETTSKPNEPFTYKAYTKGDTVSLDPEQAQRLLEAGAVKDPSAEDDGSADPTAQTTAPKGKAQDVDNGENGPIPTGTGSDAPGDGGGAGDGQGAAANNPNASTARTGRASGGKGA